MSNKVTLRLDEEETQTIIRELQLHMLTRGKSFDELPDRLKDPAFLLLFDSSSPHLKKSPAVQVLETLCDEKESLAEYREGLFEKIDELKVQGQNELSSLRWIVGDITALSLEKIETKEVYHFRVLQKLLEYEHSQDIKETWKDHSNRPGYFQGKQIPRFSEQEFEEKLIHFFQEKSEYLDEDVARFILSYYNQQALEAVRFIFLTIFQNTLSSDARAIIEYKREHLFDITVSEDGSVCLTFVEHMFSSKDSNKGLLGSQRFTIFISKDEQVKDKRANNKEFQSIVVKISEIAFDVYDQDFLQLLLSIELPLIVQKIAKSRTLSSLDKSMFTACARMHFSYNSAEALRSALTHGDLNEYDLFALCWVSHFYRSIIISDELLFQKLCTLPQHSALFMSLVEFSYDPEIIRKLEQGSVSSPQKPGHDNELEEGNPNPFDVVAQIASLRPVEPGDKYKDNLSLFKAEKVTEVVNKSQAGTYLDDPQRLYFKAFMQMLKKSPLEQIGNFLKMSRSLHEEVLKDIHLVDSLLRSDSVGKIVTSEDIVNLILKTIQINYDIHPELANKCLIALVSNLGLSKRRELLNNADWRQIFFKMASNHLDNLPFFESLTKGIDKGYWLILKGGHSSQWRYFLISLFMLEKKLSPKAQPLVDKLRSVKENIDKYKALLAEKEGAKKLVAQNAALNKGADIDAAEEQVKKYKDEIKEFISKLESLKNEQEQLSEALSKLQNSIKAVKAFIELILKEGAFFDDDIGLFEFLALVYAKNETELWETFKRNFKMTEESHDSMRPMMTETQVGYFLGKSVSDKLSKGLKHLRSLSSHPSLLIERVCTDIEKKHGNEIATYLSGLVSNPTLLSTVFESDESFLWIGQLYDTVKKMGGLGRQKVDDCFVDLSAKVLLSSLSSEDRILAVFNGGDLPEYILEHAPFDSLTLTVCVALSLSKDSYRLPDAYVKRLKSSHKEIPLALDVLERRFGLGAWIFTLFDQWSYPAEEAKALLERACAVTEDRTAPSQEMIEFLSGLTDRNLREYSGRFFKASVEEWVPAFAKYQNTGRMVDLLLRLPRESEEFRSSATVLRTPSVLDRVILLTDTEKLLALVDLLPECIERMVQLFVMDENFRRQVHKLDGLRTIIILELDAKQVAELDMLSYGEAEYEDITPQLKGLEPNLLRKWFTCLFLRQNRNHRHFMSGDVVSRMLTPHVDKSDYSVLPNLLRAVEMLPKGKKRDALLKIAKVKIEAEETEFSLLDVPASVLAMIPSLPTRDTLSQMLRVIFFKNDMLLLRLFLETEDSQLAMLLLHDSDNMLTSWLFRKYKSVHVIESGEELDIDQLSRDSSRLTARFIGSSYGHRENNTSVLGCFLQRVSIDRLSVYLQYNDLCDRLVQQMVHTIGSDNDKTPLLVRMLGSKINSPASFKAFLQCFKYLNEGFVRLAPKCQEKSFYDVWLALQELLFVKIIQCKAERNDVRDIAKHYLGKYKWCKAGDRAVLVANSPNEQREHPIVLFPCTHLFFLFKMVETPKQLVQELSKKHVALEFFNGIDVKNALILLSHGVKIRWISCFQRFANVVSAIKFNHERGEKISAEKLKAIVIDEFGEEKIKPIDITLDVLEKGQSASTSVGRDDLTEEEVEEGSNGKKGGAHKRQAGCVMF